MKRMVLISVLSLLDFRLWGLSPVKIHNGFCISSIDNLYVAPKRMLFPNQEEMVRLQNKNTLYLSPLKSEAKNSAGTNFLNPHSAMLANESNLMILGHKSASTRKRSNKRKPYTSKSTGFQIKVPP